MVTPPASDPVTVAELKNSLRIDSSVTADDTLLSDCIKAATSILEKTFGLALISQTQRLWLDKWPMRTDFLSPYSNYQTRAFALSETKALEPAVSLGIHPVSSISHIKVYDSDGAASTFDSAAYYLDTSQKSSRAVLKAGDYSWPTEDMRPAKAIEIQFVAGFSPLPSELKLGVMNFAMSLYMSRGCSGAIPPAVYTTFAPYAAARL